MKNIVAPVAALPTLNISCQIGVITPGKPKVRAPGQKMAKEQPKIASTPFMFRDNEKHHTIQSGRDDNL